LVVFIIERRFPQLCVACHGGRFSSSIVLPNFGPSCNFGISATAQVGKDISKVFVKRPSSNREGKVKFANYSNEAPA
jgi:hypothetical protein